MKKSSFLLSAAVAVLLAAVGLVTYGQTQIPKPRFTGRLADLLPTAPPGWTMKEKPIAETPEMREAVGEILNFDDGIFVDYTSTAGDRLSVYIAYWTPGKMSHRLVAGHTPDICWVNGGWERIKMATKPEMSLPADGPPQVIPEAEDRIFSAQGTPEYVWFWHLVGDKAKSYGTGTFAPWYAFLTDIWEKGINQREEQFFIRLSANKPLEVLMSTPALPSVLRQLPWPEKHG